MRYPVKSRPGRTRNIKQRDVIQFEAHSLANRLLGKEDLPRIVETRRLWEEDQAVIPDEPEGDEGDAIVLPQRPEEEPC